MLIKIFPILLVFTSAAILPSTIDNDLNELMRLHKEFLDYSPIGPSRQSYELRCQAISECCPNEQDNLYKLLTENQFNEKCLNNGTKLTESSLSTICVSTLRQLIQLTKEPIYKQYFDILGNQTNRSNRIKVWKNQMKMVCSKDELHAYYCQRNDLDKFKSCQRKVLEMVAQTDVDDDDGTIYKTYVSQWEQEYAIDNQKLRKAFSNKS